MIRVGAFLVVSSLTILWSDTSHASDFYSLLDVTYGAGLKKTFVAGPFRDRGHCDELNQIVWDNVLPSCGNCKKEAQYCDKWSNLSEPYRKVMNGQPTPFVYVIADKKNRIIFSGATRAVIVRECEFTAQNFRANGYPKARCVR